MKLFCVPSEKGFTLRGKNLRPSEKGSTLRGKNLLPEGANSFVLEQIPFQKGIGVQESKQVRKMRKNLLSDSSPIKLRCFSNFSQ